MSREIEFNRWFPGGNIRETKDNRKRRIEFRLRREVSRIMSVSNAKKGSIGPSMHEQCACERIKYGGSKC